jgi:hypothetical protein
LYFAWQCRTPEGAALNWSLLTFSFCAGAALFSRLTFGAPFFCAMEGISLQDLRSDNKLGSAGQADLFFHVGIPE